MKNLILILTVLLCLLVSLTSLAIARQSLQRAVQSKQTTKPSQVKEKDIRFKIDKRRIRLEESRFEFDREKFRAEQQNEADKLRVEKKKAVWSAVASTVPIVVALLTIIVSIISLSSQAKLQRESMQNQANLQREAQLETARLQFDIEVAEIVFAAKSADAAHNRATILEKLFPNRISKELSALFDPKEHGGGHEPTEEKKYFLELLFKYPDKQDQVIELWKQLFPYDAEEGGWLTRVQFPKSDSR